MKYGLIGERLGHSFSREIHAKIADYEYELLELAPDEVGPFLEKKEFNAINVTIPYKETVIPYLDEISEDARKIGAVNTIVRKGDRLYGYNTDYFGAEMLIKSAELDPKGKKVLILGTGGTCKTLSVVARDMGAREIVKVSRHASEEAISYETALCEHTDAEIIINTTPVGMYPRGNETPIDLDAFSSLEGVVDVIYNPLETRFASEARALGKKAVCGLLMLSAQAVYASALFLGKERQEELCDKAYREVLREKQNVVLIGMPSCGKSTVGKEIAKQLGKAFVDSDDEIVKIAGKTIPEIFAEGGEPHFRRIESEVISSLASKNGLVIATGGGAVLDVENVRALSGNGILYFLDRSPELLTPTGDRPLSSDTEALMRRYQERYPIYTAAAHVRVPADGTVTEVAEFIVKDFCK